MTDPREMQAGPELDAALAEEVMGWKVHKRVAPDRIIFHEDDENGEFVAERPVGNFKHLNAWSPSSDPAASAELRAKLWELEFNCMIFADRAYRRVSASLSLHGIGQFQSSAEVTGPDPRPAEFLAVARCALEAARARKGAK